MKWLKVGLVVAVSLVLALLLLGQPNNSAKADSPCQINVTGLSASVVCNGTPVGNVDLPTVRVTTTLPPLPEPTKIVKVPPIKIPGPTKMATVYRTKTVTKVIKKPAKTVTIQPQPTSLPSPTPETGTGQTTPKHAMIGPATPLSPSKPHVIDFGDGRTTVVEASLGIVTVIALIALLLGMYYAGYLFGFREAESKNARFIRDVLDQNA